MNQATHEVTQSERIQYLDVLRVLSMLAVVFLHTAAGTLRVNRGSAVWHFANVFTSLATASVPLFFMISGALLLRSPHTVSVSYTLKRRVPRVLIPFLVWSLVAVAYYTFVSWRTKGAPDWSQAVEKLKHLPSEPTAIHLWFMYALIPLYILSPFIKKLIDSLGRDLVVYLLAIWLFFSSLLPTVGNLLPASYRPIVTLDPRYDLTFMAGYAGYFIIGYYLMRMKRAVPTGLLASVAGAAVVCVALGTWWKTSGAGHYVEIFKTYTGIFVVVLSCALFLLVKELLRRRQLGRVARTVVGYLAPLAFGVYLVHNLIVDLLSRLIQWWPAGSVQVVIVSYLVVLAVSVALIFVLSRLKPLSYVFTGQVYGSWRKWTDRRSKPPASDEPPPDR